MPPSVAEAIYPGTAIAFLPEWAGDVWRVLVWVGIMALVARMWRNSTYPDQASRLAVYDRAALVLLLVSSAILDAERWGQPVAWEGLPPVTLALLLTWRAVVGDERWRRQHRQDRAGPPGPQ
jgi:hypothetical protein